VRRRAQHTGGGDDARGPLSAGVADGAPGRGLVTRQDHRAIGPIEGPAGGCTADRGDDVLASLEADDFTALVRSSGKGLGDLRESASHYVGTHLPTTW